MGYPYDGLVPAAILLDHPGLTREEFAERLDIVKSEGNQSIFYHQGLHGLSRILDLQHRPEYLELKEQQRDTETEKDTNLHIYHGDPNSSNEDVLAAIIFGKTPKQGTVETLVYKVSERKRPDCVSNAQTVTLFRTFTSLEGLIAEYPEYDPKFMYDFDQPSGKLTVGECNQFRWMQRDRKYYLDLPFVKDHLSTGVKRLKDSYDWTDLVLTAEAIRTGFWKVLQRRGLKHMDEFLETHPEVKDRYAQAIWDSHTSLFAKERGMTHTELMRFRLEASIPEIGQPTYPITGD